MDYLKSKLDSTEYKKLVNLSNDNLNRFISKYIKLCNPNSVFVCSDSKNDQEYIRKQALLRGEEVQLAIPGHTAHFDGYHDQARDKKHTKFLLPKGKSLGSRIKSIENQIDIIAIKDSQTHLVEIKHHRNPHRMTGLGDVKQNWATLDDVQNAKPENKNFKSWIIVNTKFSMHARKYAKAKGILLYGWNYPKGKSLRELIEEKRMYPLTILKLDTDIQQKLSAEGFLLVGELATISEQALKTRTKLSQQTVQKLIQEAQTFLNH